MNHILPEGIPKIEDNARGVAPHVPCRINVMFKDGKKHEMKNCPRYYLEAGGVFGKLDDLIREKRAKGIECIRIWVEIETDLDQQGKKVFV